MLMLTTHSVRVVGASKQHKRAVLFSQRNKNVEEKRLYQRSETSSARQLTEVEPRHRALHPLPVRRRRATRTDAYRSPSVSPPLPIGSDMKSPPAAGDNGSEGLHAVRYYGDREDVLVIGA